MVLCSDVVLKKFQDAIQLRPQLGVVEASSMNCILNKTIEKLLLIKELLRGTAKIENMDYNSLAKRMKGRVKVSLPSQEIPEGLMLSQKVKGQVCFLLDLLQETLLELKCHGSYTYIEYILCCNNLKIFDNLVVKEQNKASNYVMHYLQGNIKNIKENHHKIQEFLLESTETCLNKSVANVFAEENLGKLYTSLREETRIEKNKLKLTEKEQGLQTLTKKLNFEREEEKKIHQELDSHWGLLLEELISKVEYWTSKYNHEINQLDIELLQIKSKKDEQSKLLETLIKRSSESEELLIELKAESDFRQIEYERKLLVNRAAEKIQKWWRNIIFQKRFLTKINKKRTKGKIEKPSVRKKIKK